MSEFKSILSIIFHAIYGAVCIQLTHSSCDDCENIFFLIFDTVNLSDRCVGATKDQVQSPSKKSLPPLAIG